MTRTVAVTGIGMTTSLGPDVSTTWTAALAGKSGIRPLDTDWDEAYGLTVMFAGSIAGDPAAVLSRQESRRLDPSVQFALIAAREAWADAGSPDVDPERLATVVATGIGGVWTFLNSWDTIRERGARRVLPTSVPMLIPNAAAAYLSMEFGAKAGAHTPVSACAAGAEGIAQGADLIRLGRADVVIAGGTDSSIHPCTIAGFAAMQAMSTRNDDPQGASRPYDVTRDGFVMAEGAGIVILENAERARARGALIYAYVAGSGITTDAFHIAAPDPSGEQQAAAMTKAMADADLSPTDVVHINAHATSTPVGDMIEAAAVVAALGEDTTAVVSATKSMTGHTLGAAGAIESILTILALRDRQAPPTINVDQPEPGLAIDLVRNTPRPLPTGQIAAINNSFGFGGHNVAVAFTSA